MPSVPQSDPARPLFLRALARPRAIALGCIALLAAGGWGYLGLVLAGQQSSSIWRALCQPIYGMTGGMSLAGASLTFAMWCAMALAMMLPTAAPMVLTYADIAETAARRASRRRLPLVLTAGYVAVWLGAAAVLTAAARVAAAARPARRAHRVRQPVHRGRAVPRAPALYQFSSAKHACLTHCQRPFRSSSPTGRRAARRVSARAAAGALLPWLLLGDDAADVRGRRDECRLDGGRSAS